MTGHIGKYGTDRIPDVIDVRARAIAEEQWGEVPAKLVSVNSKKGTATVQILAKRRLNGVPTTVPELQEVAYHEGPRTGRGGLTFGAAAGDIGTMRPKMVNGESYHENGGEFDAPDARRSSLSDMEFHLDGGDSLANPMKNRDPNNVHLRFDDEGQFGVKGSPDGKVRIDGAQGNIYELLAQVVRLLATDQLNILVGSSAGSVHELQHRAAYDEIASKLEAMAL